MVIIHHTPLMVIIIPTLYIFYTPEMSLRGRVQLRHQRLREGPPLAQGAAALPPPRRRGGRGVVQRGASPWRNPRGVTEKPWRNHGKNGEK